VSKPNFSRPISTFVIRVWQEWSTEGATWRGNIEHLESKQRSGFQDLEHMLTFLRTFEIFTGEDYADDNEENKVD